MSNIEKIASDSDIRYKRKWTAIKIAAKTDIPYDEVYEIITEMGVHSNWTDWEIKNRPVDIDELVEIVEEFVEEGR